MSYVKARLDKWFSGMKKELESVYLAADDPRGQSGFSGTESKWVKLRKPVVYFIESGSFMDIGCANGYLLECVVRWRKFDGRAVDPFGIDISERLVYLARSRLPDYKRNIDIGNALTWEPPFKYDFVRTELCYVPAKLQKEYIERLLDKFVETGGRLIVAEYRSSTDDPGKEWCDAALKRMGFEVDVTRSGFWEKKELTRVGVVKKIF